MAFEDFTVVHPPSPSTATENVATNRRTIIRLTDILDFSKIYMVMLRNVTVVVSQSQITATIPCTDVGCHER
jgi:hypothetical protein